MANSYSEPHSESTAALAAPAPWRLHPDIVAEVEQLSERYSRSTLRVADVLCDDHPADNVAFTCVDAGMATTTITFGDLADQSKRLAAALQERGINRGSRVGVLMGKRSQLPVVLLAIWRLGAIHIPLFTAFAGPAIAKRLVDSGAELVVVDEDQLAKLAGIDISIQMSGPEIDRLVERHDPIAHSEDIRPDELFIQLYTSGTTGTPKAVGVPAFAIAAFISYMRYGLDLQPTDTYWNAADPGWAYGLYFGVVGPLATGIPNILLSNGFSAELTGRVINELRVSNLAASPTVYRALKHAGITADRPLRAASSAGEPLTPDVLAWAPGALGTEVRDQWGQTEQGMAIVNHWDDRLRTAVRPGSMGQALPGFTAGIAGASIVLATEASPLMWFRGYVNTPTGTNERFTADGRWYLTGDVGRTEGSDFYFASRDDDVVLAAGYRIAPFDIESILTADPSVAEAAVIGRPDEIRGEVVVAFVVLTSTASADGLEQRLQRAVRSEYGSHAYPRSVYVVDSLPKTPSGKVQRYVLRALSKEQPSAPSTP